MSRARFRYRWSLRLHNSFGKMMLFVFFCVLIGQAREANGLSFAKEPPARAYFVNTKGLFVYCIVRGHPPPTVKWLSEDDVPLSNISGIRHVLSNGTLVFPRFAPKDYRRNVHRARYKCLITNSDGSLLSRFVLVKAAVQQKHQCKVGSPISAFKGNNIMFHCTKRKSAEKFIETESWLEDLTFRIYPSERGETNGSVAPISSQKNNIHIALAGSTIVKPCAAYANPQPTHKWFFKRNKTEILISNDERFTAQNGLLTLSNVKTSESGLYYCNASNPEGTETLKVQLLVTSPLSVRIHPSVQFINHGKAIEIKCSCNGYPVTKILWYKNGRPLKFGSHIKRVTHTLIRINSPSRDDTGMYQCIVKNYYDSSQGYTQLLLGDISPQFLYKFVERIVEPGPFVSLKCSASGNPTPQISWLLDGFPLPYNERFYIEQYVTPNSDVVSYLNITSVHSEDGGEYECVAENKVGKISHSARLNVYGLPYIRPMPPISAVAGKKLVIKCSVSGYPIDYVSWKKDDVQLPTSIRQRVDNNTLTIENVDEKSDQGSYCCLVRNKRGNTSEKSVEVKVNVPPKINPFAFARDLKVGDRISVHCVAVSGDNPLMFTWLKNGEPIPKNHMVNIRQHDPFTSAMSISTLVRYHTGNYSCEVSNELANVSHTASLIVNVPPFWVVEPPEEESVEVGASVSLNCKADGFPKPSIIWKKAPGDRTGPPPSSDDYREFSYSPSNIMLLENGTLTITKTTKEHEGYYMCEANNDIEPRRSKFVHLLINAAPKIRIRSRQETAKKGEMVHLRCEAEGDLPMEIVWRIRGIPLHMAYNSRFFLRNNTLPNGFMSELTIVNVRHSDRGEYTCQCSNPYGRDYLSILLLVQESLSSPTNLHVSGRTSRSITLSWLPPPTPGDTKITNYILRLKENEDNWGENNSEMKINGEKTMEVVMELKPGTTYHFRLFAENIMGTSGPSNTLIAATEGEPPGGPPLKVSAEATSSTVIRVTWQPPDRMLWNGDIIGYNIGFKKIEENSEFYNWTHIPDSSGLPGDRKLTNLSKFTKYLISLKAVNLNGEGPPSEPIFVETMEDVPSGEPRNVQCVRSTPDSLQLVWMPPSRSTANGIIKGYKIIYESNDEGTDKDVKKTTVVSSLGVTLQGLVPFTNYSIQVLAYTRVGEGPRKSFYCATKESIPEAPAAVKAVTTSGNSAIVSWLPPKRANGILTKYTIYTRTLESKNDLQTKVIAVSAQNLHHEVHNLTIKKTYEAWVSAWTRVGQGPNSSVVRLVPNDEVPAAILSLSKAIVVPWKKECRIPCLHVGRPEPNVEWKFNDMKLQNDSSIIEIEDQSLLIKNTMPSHAGKYTCHIWNNLGSDQIDYSLVVQVPPISPLVIATAVTPSSVQLQWKQGDTGGTPILGFTLSYSKTEHEKWIELSLEPEVNTYLVKGLDCGTRYSFKLSAFNKIGHGTPTTLNSVVTKGSRPTAPSEIVFLDVHSTSVKLRLRTWTSNDCTIKSFSINKRQPPKGWTVVMTELLPQDEFVVQDLNPGVEYVLKVTAHSNAGSTSQEYVFTTPKSQGQIPNPPTSHNQGKERFMIFMDFKFFVLGCVTVVLVILLVCLFCYCFQRRIRMEEFRRTRPENIPMQNLQPSLTVNNRQNVRDGEQLRGTLNKLSQTSDHSSWERSPDLSNEILPYATFQLHTPECVRRPNYLRQGHRRQSSERRGRFRPICHHKRQSPKSESDEYDSLGSDTDIDRVPPIPMELISDKERRYLMTHPNHATHQRRGFDSGRLEYRETSFPEARQPLPYDEHDTPTELRRYLERPRTSDYEEEEEEEEEREHLDGNVNPMGALFMASDDF